MPRSEFRTAIAVALFLLAASSLQAGTNLAQYPLRVHIFQRTEHTHYYGGVIDWAEGNGRANIFENGDPRGFDFAYRCGDRIMTSSGYETYPARWKKKDQSLEILYPIMGKLGAMRSCELKVDMKDFAYYRHEGNTYTEPPSAYKQWMEKHQYDPEHGKDQPVQPVQSGQPAPEPSPSAATPAPPQ
jgi:hypothetical protein